MYIFSIHVTQYSSTYLFVYLSYNSMSIIEVICMNKPFTMMML